MNTGKNRNAHHREERERRIGWGIAKTAGSGSSIAIAIATTIVAVSLVQSAAAFTPPPNDECGSATVIPHNATSFDPALLDTTEANASLAEPQENCEVGGVGVSNTVWYTFTACGSGTISLDTIGSNYNTVLTIFLGTCAAAGPLFCSDDIAPGNLQSQLSNIAVTTGTTYLIKVGDYNTMPGGGMLDFNFTYMPNPPDNDVCSFPLMIVSNNGNFHPFSYCTAGANVTAEPQEDCEIGGLGVEHTVWYQFQPCGNGTISLNTFGSSYDTVLSVFRGTCAAPIQVACNDNSGNSMNSALSNIAVSGGLVYRIKIGSASGTPGGILSIHMSYNSACAVGFCGADIAPAAGGNDVVNIDDLLAVITNWGPCPAPCPPACVADITGNCMVNIDDLLAVISGWGACP